MEKREPIDEYYLIMMKNLSMGFKAIADIEDLDFWIPLTKMGFVNKIPPKEWAKQIEKNFKKLGHERRTFQN
jgi:hypothetical protein